MNIRKGLAGAGALGILLFSMTAGVSAEDTTPIEENNVNVEIKGGSSAGEGTDTGGLDLTLSDAIDFGEIEIASEPKTYSTGFKDNFEITDLRGSFDGWSLTVSASQLETKDGNTLAKGSLTLDGVSVIGSDNSEPPSEVLDERQAIDGGNEVLVVNANKDEGAGTFEVKFAEDALELTLDPSEARAGEYSSTLTWNLKSTPSAD